MHFYIAVSTIYIGFLIYKSCTRKPDIDEFAELYHTFPEHHYMSKINLMRYFSEEPNYNKLRTIYDNNLLPKMTEIVNNNQDIYIQYKHMERLLPGYFSFNNELKMPLTIGESVFETNIPTLNFIRWFILCDYFLYIDNIEEKKEK
tara:strand:+ start:240 stop:677 length:438 start_codon:yes stop_codon:yes gene_type:complete